MGKARAVMALVLACASLSGCGSSGSSTTDSTSKAMEQVGSICRHRFAKTKRSTDPTTPAADLSNMSRSVSLNQGLVRQVQSLSLPPLLSRTIEGQFVPAIERLDAIGLARIRALRGGDYKHVYLLGLRSLRESTEVEALARRLRLKGCY